MDGALAIDDGKQAADEVVSLKVRKLAEVDPGSQVLRLVSVTAGTAKRAFAGDFDRKRWFLAGGDTSPGVQHFGFLHARGLGGTASCPVLIVMNPEVFP